MTPLNKQIEILQFSPCNDGLEFRNQYPDFKTAWNACRRGDWMLWIAKELNVDLRLLTTAKALCVNTVRHLLVDERSTNAIDVALLFGQGKATLMELSDAAAAAADFFFASTTTAYDIDAASALAAAAADTAFASAAAASSAFAADAADAAAASAVAAAAADTNAAYAIAKINNELQTADICREVLTDAVFNAIDNLETL